jgi:hypothetical protein
MSTANIMGIDEVLSVGGRAFIFIYIYKIRSKGPKIGPWDIQWFVVLQFE